MKLIFILFSLLSFSHNAFAKWGSVVTNVEKDCVVISSSTEEAPIDFYESECKSFGGYSLFIKGSDLRYAPKLNFNSKEIELLNPYSFHDLASTEIEWLYSHEISNEGFGSIVWKGMIYSLSVAGNDDGEENGKDKVIFYAVSLNGPKTCIIGRFQNSAEASVALQNNNSLNKCIKE
jgi:hypothetical protein